MRRYLFACALTALTFVAASLFALAQSPSAGVRAVQSAGAYAQPQSSVQGILSSKQVTIVANGISPRALAIHPNGNVYLTNASAPNRIFTLTGLADHAAAGRSMASARLALVAGNGAAGSLGDGGSALAAQFHLKTDSLAVRSGIAVAPDGTIFIADTRNSTVRRIAGADSAEPGITRSIAGRWASPPDLGIIEPVGVALDASGNLYVTDNKSGAIDLLAHAAASSLGEQQVRILAHVAAPASIALTPDGRKAFVASPETGALVEIDTQTREIQPVPGFSAQKSKGQNHPTSACETTAAQPSGAVSICPSGLAVDGAGNLFVADANSGNVLRIDAKTSALETVASGLRSPGAMSFDRYGNLYVAEQGADRIIRFASMGASPANLTITPPAALPPPPSPRVCPQTAPFDFCDQPVGGSTPTQAFTVTNNTSAAVSGLTISLTGSNAGDFQAPSNTCGTSLAAGASCVVDVDFAPTASGARSASLSVTDAAADSVAASVTGTGDDYQLAFNGSQQEESVIQGGTLTYKFNIVPDAVFGGTVTIVCPTNLPSLTTCAPSADTVTVTPGTSAPFSVTFQTTYNGVTGGLPSNGSVPFPRFPGGSSGPAMPPFVLWAIGILLVGAAGLGWFLWRRRTLHAAHFFPARSAWVMSVLLAIAGAALVAGCKHHTVPSNLNTPAGTTTMTVQGTAQNAGRGITIILSVTGRG